MRGATEASRQTAVRCTELGGLQAQLLAAWPHKAHPSGPVAPPYRLQAGHVQLAQREHRALWQGRAREEHSEAATADLRTSVVHGFRATAECSSHTGMD